MYLVFYLLIKYVFYTCWCYIGLRFLACKTSNLNSSITSHAATLGFYRILLSIGFGILIGLIVGPINSVIGNDYLTYIAVYSPVRIIEWGFIGYLIVNHEWDRIMTIKFALWVAGGILVSFLLTDLPVFAVLGGPFTGKIGRVFC
ncbi:hypothetical protein TDB9533_00532 [Thalassocella blandensis]|nr:hypothetical protein TDB9533_00532 [Thalassocella blandensis]